MAGAAMCCQVRIVHTVRTAFPSREKWPRMERSPRNEDSTCCLCVLLRRAEGSWQGRAWDSWVL